MFKDKIRTWSHSYHLVIQNCIKKGDDKEPFKKPRHMACFRTGLMVYDYGYYYYYNLQCYLILSFFPDSSHCFWWQVFLPCCFDHYTTNHILMPHCKSKYTNVLKFQCLPHNTRKSPFFHCVHSFCQFICSPICFPFKQPCMQ